MIEIDPDRDVDVPPDASPVDCPVCGRPFVRERHRDLHVALEHGDRVGQGKDVETSAVEGASEAERDELRLFRLKALVVLVVLYFGLLFTYSIVT